MSAHNIMAGSAEYVLDLMIHVFYDHLTLGTDNTSFMIKLKNRVLNKVLPALSVNKHLSHDSPKNIVLYTFV